MRISPARRASAEMHNIGQIHAGFLRKIEGFGSQVAALRQGTRKPDESMQDGRNILSVETQDLDPKPESNAISCNDILVFGQNEHNIRNRFKC